MERVARDDLLPGVRLSLANGREFLEASLLLIDAGRLRPAANIFSLGAQEVGKAKLLSDAFASGASNPEVALYDHRAKVEAARIVLGSSAMWLTDSAFQPGVFQANAFQVGVPADEPRRLEVTYVNYGSTGWQVPPTITPESLRTHITDALALIPSLATKLGG